MRAVWSGFMIFSMFLGMLALVIWFAASEDISDTPGKCERVNDVAKLMQRGSYHKTHSKMTALSVNAP